MNNIPPIPEVSSMLSGLWLAWVIGAVVLILLTLMIRSVVFLSTPRGSRSHDLLLEKIRWRVNAACACVWALFIVAAVPIAKPLGAQTQALEEYSATYRWKLECFAGSDCSAEEQRYAEQCANHARQRYGGYRAHVPRKNRQASMLFMNNCLGDKNVALVRCPLNDLDCVINGRVAPLDTPWTRLTLRNRTAPREGAG